MPNKRKNFTLQEKLDMIMKVDENPQSTRVQIAATIGLAVSSLNTILSKREFYEKQATETISRKRKRNRAGKYEEIENCLVKWFEQVRAADIPVGGPLIREKAEEIALKKGIEFTPSNGWIDRFRKRYGIVYRSISGEANSVSDVDANEWINNSLPQMLAGYDPRDVFNADECALFYNLLPDKTMSYKGETCHGGKRSKERITVLLCANQDGSEKLKPLIIGKSEKPRCFKGIRSLPCDYSSSPKAWITSVRFKQYLYSLDARMGVRNRKILLFVDRCSAHPTEVEHLRNMKVIFFPPNATSKLQPLDQGIIKVAKQRFRQRLVRRLLRSIETRPREDATSIKPKFNILDAMHFLAASWDSVSPQIIENCFRKAGFVCRPPAEDGLSDDEDIDDEPDEWLDVQERLRFAVDFNDFVDVDNDLLTCSAPDVDDVIASLNKENASEDEDGDAEIHEDDVVLPTYSEAIAGLETFSTFVTTVTNVHVDEDIFKMLYKLEKFSSVLKAKSSTKQTTLDSFLHK